MRWTILAAVAAIIAVAGCHHEHPPDDVPAVKDQVIAINEWANGNNVVTPQAGSVNYYLQYVEEMLDKLRTLCDFLETAEDIEYDCKLPPPPSGSNPPQGRPPTFP